MAAAREALGWVIVGGLGLATLSTLYLTPVAFVLLAGLPKPKIEEEARLTRELGAALGARDQLGDGKSSCGAKIFQNSTCAGSALLIFNHSGRGVELWHGFGQRQNLKFGKRRRKKLRQCDAGCALG